MRQDKAAGIRFSGHAAVFNRLTDLGLFREQVAPGTFARAIRERDDVVLLFNHSPDTVMARVGTGSLQLQEDDRGLRVTASLDPDDLDVQRVVPKLRRGDLSRMSFAFRVPPGGDTWDDYPEDGGLPIRTLQSVRPLIDVAAVTFPAYEDTDAQLARSVEESWKIHAQARARRLRIMEIESMG